MKTLLFVCLLSVSTLTSLSQTQTTEWHTGVLVSVDHHQETDVIRGEQRNAGITWHLQVDIGDRIVFVDDHFGYIWDHTPKLTVENVPIKWENVKGKFVFLDENGRQFKGTVVKQRMKITPEVSQ